MNKDENEKKVEEKKKKEGGCCGGGSSKKKKKSKPKLLSLLTIGNQEVGKTAILSKFIDNTFMQKTVRTTSQEFRVVERTIKIDNEDVKQKVKIWDSSGQERFRSIVISSAKNTNGIFLVYDVTSQKTFDDLQGWIQSIEEAKDLKTFPFIIMANKIDLEEQRVISHEQGKAFAESKKMPYFETSAKTGQGLNEALDYLITVATKSVMGIPNDNIII